MYIPWEVNDELSPLVRKAKRSSSEHLPGLTPIITNKRPRSSSCPPATCHREPGWYIKKLLEEKEDGICLLAEDEQHLRDVREGLCEEMQRLDTKEWPDEEMQRLDTKEWPELPVQTKEKSARANAKKTTRCGAKPNKPKEAAKPEEDMVMTPREIRGNSRGLQPYTRVRICSYGRKLLANVGGYNHLNAVKELRDHAESRKNNFAVGLSVEAMRQVLKYNKDQTDPIVMDCRVFFEDKAKLRTATDWHHTGKHPCNVQRLFTHNHGHTMHRFLETLQPLVRQRQRNKKPMDPDILDICLECNQGRDRSVGCAVALSNAFKLSGWSVKTSHLCESGWIYKSGCEKAAKEATYWGNPHATCPHCTVASSRDYVDRMVESGSFPGLQFPIR